MININFSNLNSRTHNKIAKLRDNHTVINGRMYDLEGEYIGDRYSHELKVNYSDEQIEGFKSKHEMITFEKEHGGFVFLFYQVNKSMTAYTNNLTKPDITRLLQLTTYVAYDTNKIQYDNGRSISDKDLATMLRLKPRQYNTYIKKLIDNNILTIDIDGNKYISNHICKNGSLDKKQLHKHDIKYTRLFRNTVRKLYDSSTVREFSRISTIYMILPYINLYTNIISHNPNEIDEDKVIPMSMMELANKLGYSDCTKLKSAMYKTIFEDEYSFAFVSLVNDRRKMKIFVNPKLMFAGSPEMLKVLLIIFREFNKSNKTT